MMDKLPDMPYDELKLRLEGGLDAVDERDKDNAPVVVTPEVMTTLQVSTTQWMLTLLGRKTLVGVMMMMM